MDETTPENDDGFGGFGDDQADAADEPGTDLEPVETVDAEPIDESEPEPEDDELIGDGRWATDWTAPPCTDVEPYKIRDDPAEHGWGTPEDKPIPDSRQRDNDGTRPGGGSRYTPRPDGQGNGAGSGKVKRRRRGSGGGNGGSGVHVSLFGGVLNNTAVVRTGPIGSGNAVVKGRTGSGHTAGGVVNGTPGRSKRGSGTRSKRSSW